VSRRTFLSLRAGGSVDSVLPLRGYLLSVGGALLCLLLAVDWVLPAPLPDRVAQWETALPSIRIHSDAKRPEQVVIDTSRPVPLLGGKEISMASVQLGSSDPNQEPLSLAAVDDDGGRPATSMTSPIRESLALSVADQVPGGALGSATSAPRRTVAHSRHGKRWRSAGHPTSDNALGWCDPFDHGACR
jgi:hypothetical protein